MTEDRGVLLAIDPDGTTREVPNTYQGIREGVGGTIDFVRINHRAGMYIDDNGMLEGAPLNTVASCMSGMALYGNVVLCGADPDEDGDQVPADEMVTQAAQGMAQVWRLVVADAERKGQSLVVRPNADTIPPARIIPLDDESFARWLEGGDVG